MILSAARTHAALAFNGTPDTQHVVYAGEYLLRPNLWNDRVVSAFRAQTKDLLDLDVPAGDVTVRAVAEDVTGEVVSTFRLVPWWTPASRVVELRGGPRHSTVLTMDGAPMRRELLVPVVAGQPVAASVFDAPAGGSAVAVEVPTVRYVLSGWITGSRRWVYSPASSVLP